MVTPAGDDDARRAVIFVDSNIPMYLVGEPHPNKDIARQALQRAIDAEERLVTSVEVFQEILHRYVAIGRREAIDAAFEVLQAVVDEVFPILPADVQRARAVVVGHERLSARDALHIAVMERTDVRRIFSFDIAFDDLRVIRRIAG